MIDMRNNAWLLLLITMDSYMPYSAIEAWARTRVKR
jgi:hypothetical protein